MRELGRLLQLIGLTVPPISMVMQLSNAIKASQMLMILVASVCCFGIGVILQRYTK